MLLALSAIGMDAGGKKGMSGTRRSVLAALAAVAVFTAAAEASQFKAFARKGQVAASELIVVGRVTSVRSGWDSRRSAIHTDAEVAIDEVWKGSPASDRVVVRTLGGRVDDVALEVDGAATFHQGERLLVFLHSTDDVYVPAGMRFGKYEIVDEGGASFAVGALPPTVSGAQHYPQVSVPLDELRTEVASLVSGEVK
jgi:hypothetical protein